jgi:predicted permease
VGAYLEKAYPKEFGHSTSNLQHMGLSAFTGPVRAFVTGLMLLAGLILLAACANLGSLFAARASDRGREIALRIALGSSRKRILRQLLTEAVIVSLLGGALGLMGSVVLLRRLSVWRPFPGVELTVPVNPDAKVYMVALILALVSGLLFGIVPLRQVLRANPFEIVKAGPGARTGRRMTVRDLLLVVQIAICAVLVTSSLVAVRGLINSVHANFGFEPRNTVLMGTTLAMAGYSSDQITPMQQRMIHALETIPGVEGAGLIVNYPPLVYTAGSRQNVFKEDTKDMRPANAAASPYAYAISPGYLGAACTALLAGRDFSWNDDKGAPDVALVNRNLAVTVFGSVSNAVGKYIRSQDGLRLHIVGVVEDGKYVTLTGDQQPAMFLSFLQSPTSKSYVVVRSRRDPQELTTTIRNRMRVLDSGLPTDIETWTRLMDVVQFPSRVATAALGALGVMGAMLSITGIFGMAAYSVSKRLRELGIRVALGAQRKEVLEAALGRAFRLLTVGSLAGLILGLLATRVLASIVYQASPRDPVVLAGAVLAMASLGLIATWIPARRALSINPMKLLREE